MILQTQDQYNQYKKAAQISIDIMRRMVDRIKAGVVPLEIDHYGAELMKQHNVQPSFLGVQQSRSPKFKHVCTISVNDAVLHGVPDPSTPFEPGDIVKLDIGIIYKGFFTDHCYTFVIEDYASAEDKKVVQIAKLATETAVKRSVVGNWTGDLGDAMYSVAHMAGLDVLKGFVGHSIGTTMWEDPQIPAYGVPKTGDKLKPRQVLCVESQVVQGSDEVEIDDDGWTVRTVDGGKGAMFEYMVIVRDGSPEVLTDNRDWPIILN